jgi:Na+-transporting NADH:ubiquinone oxidoreductase subunit A
VFTSPVSGEVVEIVRGARRAIQEIKILADSKNVYKDFGKENIDNLDSSAIISKLKNSGAWAFLRQRPFNRLVQFQIVPNNIFISGFDSAPYAVDYDFALKGQTEYLQVAVNALAKLTSGKVYIGLSLAQKGNSIFEGIKNCVITYFDGPHPAGNVGVQIHHTAPINKGDVVWTINPQDLLVIGRLFAEGIYNTERMIALAGDELKRKGYVRSFQGAQISNFLAQNLNKNHVRIISGNPLTGDKINNDSFLGFYHHVVSVLEEGDEPELFGWLLPSYPRPSFSRTFPAFISPMTNYKVNTNMHGEERAFVVTGEYEKVLPMDVLPMQLFKACLANDIDNMEALGIYEVVEEDIALCEFICTSKLPLQSILRDGLNYLENEA